MTQKLDLQLFFITLILLVLGLTTAVREYSGLFFIITLLIVGIPHGSLDHLIYYKNNGPKVNKVLFYVKYLSLITVVGIFWILLPTLSFILFLFISAFHFGQSQLFRINVPNVLQLPYHLSWGALLLSIIILTNLSECLSIFTSLEWLNTAWVTRSNLLLATVVSLLTFLGIHTFLLLSKRLKGRYFMFEIGLLIVFTIMSLTTNAIFTFTVYFGLWHSYRSLILEYNTIKVKATYGLSAFLKDVSPYSILGTAFLLLAYGLSSYFDLGISFYMIFIIIISTLTVPHLIVMHNLYTR